MICIIIIQPCLDFDKQRIASLISFFLGGGGGEVIMRLDIRLTNYLKEI